MTAILAVSSATWQYFVYPVYPTIFTLYPCPDAFKYSATSKEVFVSFYVLQNSVTEVSGECGEGINFLFIDYYARPMAEILTQLILTNCVQFITSLPSDSYKDWISKRFLTCNLSKTEAKRSSDLDHSKVFTYFPTYSIDFHIVQCNNEWGIPMANNKASFFYPIIDFRNLVILKRAIFSCKLIYVSYISWTKLADILRKSNHLWMRGVASLNKIAEKFSGVNKDNLLTTFEAWVCWCLIALEENFSGVNKGNL